jgi:hypothetical protein
MLIMRIQANSIKLASGNQGRAEGTDWDWITATC